MSERPVLLKVDNVKKWFPVRKGVFAKVTQQVKAVDGVSLCIRAGETLASDGREAFPGVEAGEALALRYETKVNTEEEVSAVKAATVVFTIAAVE